MKITLKDIAKMAHVSTTTVSLVLNNRKNRVSQAKRDEILAIAQQYNYKVNLVARSLVTNESKILGLILPDIENVFFSSLAQQLEQAVRGEGYALFIMSSNEKDEDDLWLVNHLEERGVDGIFICPANSSLQNKNLAKRLSSVSYPFVMVDRVYPDYPFNKVHFDNEWGAYEAVSYLISQGHRKIGCIAPPYSRHNGNSRLKGYIKAHHDYNLAVDDTLILEGDYKFASGYAHAKTLIEDRDITAIFSCNDMMTLGTMRYAHENNIAIPKDISLVSYDNTLDYFTLSVGISSIEQDVSLLVQSSVAIMFDHLKHPKTAPIQEIKHKPRFIIKGSVEFLEDQ